MPFPFDLSQVFWGLMNKTMWDCRLGNMNGFTGFNGGFMNSCWGGGFQMPMWGDSFSSTTNGSSSSTVEDEVEKRQLTRKQNTLYKLLEDYAKSLPEGTERDTIEVTLNRYKSVKQENYDALQALYEENKTKIQKKFNNGSRIEASNESKTAATDFAKTNTDFKTILKVGEDNNTTTQLKDGVDALEFLYSLQTTKKKSFKTLYAEKLTNADSDKKAEMKKVLEAVYENLTKTALELKKDNAVSEETRASIAKLLEIADTNAAPENVDQLYYWIRMAKAEIADSKYASLHEDFPDDPLLGKANGVDSTTAALKTEGVDVENIKKQTAVTDFSGQTGEQNMQKLVDDGYVTALTKEQLTTLNDITGVPKGIKTAWVDKNSRYNYQIIRYVDKDGNMKYVSRVGLKDGEIQKVGGEVKAGESISPEQIQQQAATLAAVEAAADTLVEVKAKSDGTRVFQEKVTTGDRNYKRLFIVDSDGSLKEWQGVWLDEAKAFRCEKGSQTPNVDAKLDDIKTDVQSFVSEEDLLSGKAIENASWGEENIVSLTPYENDQIPGFRIWGGDRKLNDQTLTAQTSFKELYNGNYCIEIFTAKKRGAFESDQINVIAKDKLTTLGETVVKALAETGLKKDKLQTAANAVITEWLTGINNDKDDVDDYAEIANKGCDTSEERKLGGSAYNLMAAANPEKLTIQRDGKGRNQAIGMISFQKFVDAILQKYNL